MSRHLSQLLGHPERSIAKLVGQLEAKNGYPSHDVRLSAENIQQVRQKIGQLQLDPDDTTADELYQSLVAKYQNDARRFDEHFGVYGKSFDDKITKAAELITKNIGLPERWVLKVSSAKELLRQHPPKKLMKELNYRSIESLLKRQDLAEIYLAIELLESPTWNKVHFRLAAKLDSTAFAMRPLRVAALAASKWGLYDTDQLYAYSSDYGAIGLVPTERNENASLLCLLALLLDELDVAPSQAAVLSPAAAWWVGTDRLIAGLESGPVSLNINDIAQSRLSSAELNEHSKLSAQKHFWRELLSRYQNQIAIAEDSLPKFDLPIANIRAPVEQPVLEYVEEL